MQRSDKYNHKIQSEILYRAFARCWGSLFLSACGACKQHTLYLLLYTEMLILLYIGLRLTSPPCLVQSFSLSSTPRAACCAIMSSYSVDNPRIAQLKHSSNGL